MACAWDLLSPRDQWSPAGLGTVLLRLGTTRCSRTRHRWNRRQPSHGNAARRHSRACLWVGMWGCTQQRRGLSPEGRSRDKGLPPGRSRRWHQPKAGCGHAAPLGTQSPALPAPAPQSGSRGSGRGGTRGGGGRGPRGFASEQEAL